MILANSPHVVSTDDYLGGLNRRRLQAVDDDYEVPARAGWSAAANGSLVIKAHREDVATSDFVFLHQICQLNRSWIDKSDHDNYKRVQGM